jgi:thiosulfate/3-mercaptopyruvate sulfurtransferase
MLDPVITARELSTLNSPVLVDCRTGPDARARYVQAHLPGARFVDLDADLAEIGDASQGGRHPLPSPARFAVLVGKLGITKATSVVAYDEQNGANAAARFWWMLRALGHERVQVLDGGLQGALADGLTTTSEPAGVREEAPYPQAGWQLPTADIEEVDGARQDASRRVLDVRAAPRFRGEQEPIDPIAGHIPGAYNVPLGENLVDGRFKSREGLSALYTPLLGTLSPEALIVHCGSGVTACHTLLALERAGLSGAKLYVGSWSEWCRKDRPRASVSG